MAGQLSSFPSGIQSNTDQKRAIATLSINGRARNPQGAVGLVTDLVIFKPDNPAIPQIGQWFMANQRVRVMGTPTVGQSAVGIVYLIPPGPSPTPIGPMSVVQGDPRSKAI